MASNRFWHIVSVVKEQSPPVQQKGTATAQGVSQSAQRLSTRDLRFPQPSSVGPAKCLRHGAMRVNSRQSQRIAVNTFSVWRNPMKKIPLSLIFVLLFGHALPAQNPRHLRQCERSRNLRIG